MNVTPCRSLMSFSAVWPLLLAVTLTGCGWTIRTASPPSIDPGFCRAAKPIPWTGREPVSQLTAITLHNCTGWRLCDWDMGPNAEAKCSQRVA